ncbi:Aconitate hydratase precursor [Enhygromyxa salina]|uniref:Aconitate hydratase n=1 Tax=Enhygromyxa salina TaxID=215803 RepID=A0A2S9XJL2_9BACT|nr:aconitate hydratase AcnA [Enhygromyxa salina]PRP93055.1 Aconitate hydratase precursor [Enhygromyxa salina]
MTSANPYDSRSTFDLSDGSQGVIFRLQALEDKGLTKLAKLPFSIRVLVEAALRNHDGFLVTDEDVKTIAGWQPRGARVEIPFIPARVILQDFTGVPAVVDIAACRNAMVDLGGDAAKVNPAVNVDLVIDHSVQVDTDGRHQDALLRNLDIEYKRNNERYEFLKWGQHNLDNFRAVPPGRGIVHQVNLEWIADVAFNKNGTYYPDSLVGTDSHTTMINGLGVLGWGVGGIEAEAVMLGQPVYMLAPDVVGFKLKGKLRAGVTATDMTLRIVEMLREKGVVGKFVEFYGGGLDSLSLADRATIANMAPEYGATCGFFPVDAQTIAYLRLSGRSDEHVANVEAYYRAQGLFRTDATPDPEFTDTLELDLAEVDPALAGPKRPQDRVNLSDMKTHFRHSLTAKVGHQGHGLSEDKLGTEIPIEGQDYSLGHGDVVIAAITSCTNTSNPAVMLAAGLLARNAAAKGLTTKPWVKTSLAPGSRVVTDYYDKAGLSDDLAKLGFNVVGYGCTTCIGNSGPLPPEIDAAITKGELVVGSVISGNRNFEGRVHNKVKASYLASPPLVVAYAIAGTLDVNFDTDPIGKDSAGNDVMLKDVWPSDEEIREVIASAINPEMFRAKYSDVTEEPRWDAIEVADSALYPWNGDSTYIQQPPFFQGITPELPPIQAISGAKVLLKLGDSVTTDHISPAGSIPADGPAGKYLISKGVPKAGFNSFGSRRGNHEVMMRGTFANVRIRNQIAPGTEGGYTTYWPSGEVEFVYDAAMKYVASGTPLVVLGGTQYGTGSSRDWAAKGTLLLGVKAVITKSFERIHRSNLVGMGVLPLCFAEGEGAEELGLDGSESFDIPIGDDVSPLQELEVTATKADGSTVKFKTTVRLDTPVEVDYYKNGGILQTVLRNMAKS